MDLGITRCKRSVDKLSECVDIGCFKCGGGVSGVGVGDQRVRVAQDKVQNKKESQEQCLQ